ncbi:MAG: TolC family protein [Candidatus Omnitrophota bacterium]
MKSIKNKTALAVLAILMVNISSLGAFESGEGVTETVSYEVSPEDCVVYSIANSFEAKLAKLDLLIAETRMLYSEAVFDTVFFGNVSYAEDKRQPVSVFSGDDRQTNLYSAGVRKQLPSGTELTVSWSDQRDWVNSPFVTTNPSHNAQLIFEAVQPVLNNAFGFVDRSRITLTKLAIMNADLENRERIEKLTADVEKKYWAVVYYGKMLEAYEDMLEKARELNKANARNYELGLIESPDMLSSEANVLMREKDVIIAKEEYERSRDDLKLLMNIQEPVELVPAVTFNTESKKADLEESLKTAFDKNREYQRLKREVEMSDISLKIKGNQLWPELDLEGTIAMNGLEGDFSKAAGKTTVADNTYYYLGAKISFPLENSMARAENYSATYEKERALVSLKQKERSIITVIGNAFRALMSLNTTVVKVKEAARLQSEKLKEEEKRFSSGRSRTKTLIDYQTDLINAERAEAGELFAREVARINMEKEMNVLLEKYEDLL